MQSTRGAVPPPGFIVVLVSGRVRVGGGDGWCRFPVFCHDLSSGKTGGNWNFAFDLSYVWGKKCWSLNKGELRLDFEFGLVTSGSERLSESFKQRKLELQARKKYNYDFFPFSFLNSWTLSTHNSLQLINSSKKTRQNNKWINISLTCSLTDRKVR